MLGKVGDDSVLGRRNLTARSGAYASKDFEQGTLTRPVLTHEGNTVFLVNYKTNVAKQRAAAKLDGESIY